MPAGAAHDVESAVPSLRLQPHPPRSQPSVDGVSDAAAAAAGPADSPSPSLPGALTLEEENPGDKHERRAAAPASAVRKDSSPPSSSGTRPPRVGLAVDAFSRKLMVLGRTGSPAGARVRPQHHNLEAAQAAGVPLWMTIENDIAWEWFKELDVDQSGVLDMEVCQSADYAAWCFRSMIRETIREVQMN